MILPSATSTWCATTIIPTSARCASWASRWRSTKPRRRIRVRRPRSESTRTTCCASWATMPRPSPTCTRAASWEGRRREVRGHPLRGRRRHRDHHARSPRRPQCDERDDASRADGMLHDARHRRRRACRGRHRRRPARVLGRRRHPRVRRAPGADRLPRVPQARGLPSGNGSVSAADHRGHPRLRAGRWPGAGARLRHSPGQRRRSARSDRGQSRHHPGRRRHPTPAPARGPWQSARDDPHRHPNQRERSAGHRAGGARGARGRGAGSGPDAGAHAGRQGAGGAALRQGSGGQGPGAPAQRRDPARERSGHAAPHDGRPGRRRARVPRKTQAALHRSLMPFSYYARLSRAQQAIYRKSDEIIEVRLPRPEDLHPLVEDLATALTSEDRALTQETTARLILGLCKVLGMPAVRVEVLAARPHARWGELHGLYTAERGRTPKIQLWMRTAKQRRVVAFRTYLRTLLHEVGHHIDYTLLRLRDSMHTEGFYKRESSLFHQLVPSDRGSSEGGVAPFGERTAAMPTIEEYAKQPVAQRLGRLERTADELVAAVKGHNPGVLGRRPDGKNWAAVEVLCHLRDVEEFFQLRFEAITTMDEPRFSPANPDRWAEDRQYLRNDAGEALAAFRRRREETLTALRKMTADQWKRAGIHPARGRMSADDVLTLMAWHDDNHLDQLKRA